ncbi:MAG: preprotein translocase subunit SecA, partial [Rubritepida sp.]|nr:preprotein translocase subunit SecA [Rubritepida sp.]
KAIPENAYPEQWDLAGLEKRAHDVLGLELPIVDWGKEEGIDEVQIRERIENAADQTAAARAANLGPDFMRMVEKSLLLQVFDQVWKEHLLALDHLRQGIGLRAYGQRDPLNEYKREAFALFNNMLGDMRERTTSLLLRLELQPNAPLPEHEPVRVTDMRHPSPQQQNEEYEMDPAAGSDYGVAAATARVLDVDPDDPTTWDRTPRNAPCPCGSGKKYKHCHGRS